MKRISMKAARIYANMTEEEVCFELKIKPTTLRCWETGRSVPSLGHAVALADLYGLTLDEISFLRTDNTGDDADSMLFTMFRQMTEAQRELLLRIMDLTEDRPDRMEFAANWRGKMKDLPAALAQI